MLEPEILFLDEPTASIDVENTEIIESIISEMKRESWTTVIMTTHDREQAERIADSLLVMKQGMIQDVPIDGEQELFLTVSALLCIVSICIFGGLIYESNDSGSQIPDE